MRTSTPLKLLSHLECSTSPGSGSAGGTGATGGLSEEVEPEIFHSNGFSALRNPFLFEGVLTSEMEAVSWGAEETSSSFFPLGDDCPALFLDRLDCSEVFTKLKIAAELAAATLRTEHRIGTSPSWRTQTLNPLAFAVRCSRRRRS